GPHRSQVRVKVRYFPIAQQLLRIARHRSARCAQLKHESRERDRRWRELWSLPAATRTGGAMALPAADRSIGFAPTIRVSCGTLVREGDICRENTGKHDD